MNSKNPDHLKNEIQQKIFEALNNSKLQEVFQSYDFIGDKVIKVEYMLDLTKIQLGDANEDDQVKNSLQENAVQELVTVTCLDCNGRCCNCCG